MNIRLWTIRAVCFLAIAVPVFVLWWWKFQRHMDNLINARASCELARARSGGAGP